MSLSKEKLIKMFQTCKKYEPTDKDISILYKDINNKVMPLLKYLMKEQNANTPEKLKDGVSSFIYGLLSMYAENRYIDSYLYRIQAIEEILRDHSIITELYPMIKDTAYNTVIYTSDKKRSQKLALRSALEEVLQAESFAEEFGITQKTNINSLEIPEEHIHEVKDLLRFTKNVLKAKSMHDKLCLALEAQKDLSEDIVKKNQISSMHSLHLFFSAFNFVDTYIGSYNSTKEKFGFEDLEYSVSNFDKSFSEDLLKTLPMRDLCFLNAFWSNRLAKECPRLLSAFSVINSLDLWQDIIDDPSSLSIPKQDVILSMKKATFLSRIIGDTFSSVQKQATYCEIRGKDTSPLQDVEKDFNDFAGVIGNEYSDFFGQGNSKNNNFIEDITFASPFVNFQMLGYRRKDTALEPLIKYALDTNYLKNWGLVRYEWRDGVPFDVLSTKNRTAIVAFDIKGLNFPLCYHYFIDDLLDVTSLNTPSCIIPEYQGHEDFVINGEFVPSNIAMPVLSQHIPIIKKGAQQDDPMRNFYEHLLYLAKGKFPAHLSETIKGQTRRKPVYYTSLASGKRFIKDKNNFIEVDDDGR